jgi:hypothetical protein
MRGLLETRYLRSQEGVKMQGQLHLASYPVFLHGIFNLEKDGKEAIAEENTSSKSHIDGGSVETFISRPGM